MSLAVTLKSMFDPAVRQRGDGYFQQDRVELEPPRRQGVIEARVQGSDPSPYEVKIDTTGDEAELICSCPYGEAWGGYCKHIWAVLRAADAELRGVRTGRAAHAAAAIASPTTLRSQRAVDDTVQLLAPIGIIPNPAGIRDRPMRPRRRARQRSAWRALLADLDQGRGDTPPTLRPQPPPWYVLDVQRSLASGRIELRTCRRTVKKNGTLGVPRPHPMGGTDAHGLTDPNDRLIVGLLAGIGQPGYGGYYGGGMGRDAWSLDAETLRMMLPALWACGRLLYQMSEADEAQPLRRDDGPAWEACLALTPAERRGLELRVLLLRADERRDVRDVALLIEGAPGLCVLDGALADLETFGCPAEALRDYGAEPIRLASRDARRVVEELTLLTSPPRLELPADHALTVVRDMVPTGQVELSIEDRRVLAQVSYRYGDIVVPGVRRGGVVVDRQGRRQILRDTAAERALASQLPQVGLEEERWREGLCAPVARLPAIVRALSERGWTVLADGKMFRRAGDVDIQVTSGVDWFDVDARMDFEGASVALPELLKALRTGQQYVRLDDGTLGMLPEEWLKKHGLLLELGKTEGEKLRFSRTAAMLLDQLLAEHSKVRVDAEFAEVREKLGRFEGIRPIAAAAGFVGTLRGYQEHGLGWMDFLDEFGWGGCLADDMGLGKTVQVLAWLAGRDKRETSKRRNVETSNVETIPSAGKSEIRNPKSEISPSGRPSLVVAPKSVVFNWVDEARRFTPQLRVLAYHGTDRAGLLSRLGEYDLIVTTYHTARIDIADLAKREFEYVILDEAQMVKNAKAQVAKAVKLLRGRRRLVLTGTPVENHLGDLWSIFDFLNPGMLGVVSAFRGAFGGSDATTERLDALRRAVRPFLLRRTKEAVAPELPSKTEETLVCEMTASQAKKYAELRDYYRAAVLGKVDAIGLARAKIHVLEALLRLRQAACHPRLLDAKVAAEDAGKIDALMPLLTEVIEGGHKALVFSQFTSFLSILRDLLDKQGTTYEYLDGQTRDRRERVERFQTDPDCRLFLISLKAGGLGLNLTAADYVFILDPWWNPAAEAQAIDRAHRIGQDKKVIAYRLIAKGTVEEKILELQGRKRDLAASIITQANSLISELTREDLEVLLS